MPLDKDPATAEQNGHHSTSPESHEKPVLGEPIQVLTETIEGMRQWSLAVLLGVEDTAQQSEARRYRVSFGDTEEWVRQDSVRFFPKNQELSSLEEIYRQGMLEAERICGEEVRDYDRVLCGLCHVLRLRGLTFTPTELSQYFHSPLASCSAQHSFEDIVRAMHTTLAENQGEERRLSWDQEQVLKGALYAYRQYRSLEDLVCEDDLRQQRRVLQAALAASPKCRGTLANRLATARRDAEYRRTLCRIVEVLLGAETPQIRAERAFADELVAAAEHLETRLLGEIQVIEDRLVALPRERAQSLQPISTLKLRRSTFAKNTAELDAEYLTDGSFVIPKTAVKGGQKRVKSLTCRGYRPEEEEDAVAPEVTSAEETDSEARPGVIRISNEVCDSAFRRFVTGATDEATLLGYFVYRRRDSWDQTRILSQKIALAVTAADEAVFLGADYVRFILSAIGRFDAITVSIKTAGPAAQKLGMRYATAAVFHRDGEPVAILMPLRYTLDEIPLDLATARHRLLASG